MPVIIEFSRCIGTYSSAKFEFIRESVERKMNKKKYSAEELLMYAYKYNTIPSVLFAKDKNCRYIYTSEVEKVINGGEENSIIGKTDLDVQYDPELGKMYYEQDKEIIRSGKPIHCYSEFYINGKREFREISKNPLYSNGEIIGVCGVVSDVTGLMNLKERYETFMFKPGAAVAVARRGGCTAALDGLNKYFGTTQMPIAGSTYWNMTHGLYGEEASQDEEGM